MLTRFIAALAAALATAAVTVAGAVATPTATDTGTTVLESGAVILFDNGGTAHRLHGVVPSVTNALVALAGHEVQVYGTFDRSDIPNSPMTVQDFRVLPGGALNGETVTITGPTQRLSDGGVIVYDRYGNGHRLLATSTTSTGTIDALAGKRVTVTGVATVTNAASRIHWPILVQSIGPAT